MNETQGYSAEYAALNHEIYNLTRQLEAKEKEYRDSTAADRYDPFKNPTEYRWYRDDYSEILPWVTMPEFSVPFEPAKVEKAAIRRFYNIGGLTALFRFIFSELMAGILSTGLTALLTKMNPGASSTAVSHYMTMGAIFVAINMFTFLAANVGFAFIGLKWAKIKPSSLLKTRDYHVSDAIMHCLVGLFIWITSAYISTGIEDIVSKYGFSTEVLDLDMGKTGLGIAIMTIYSCLIAPITEELFFRGTLMKIFSKSNQRFGIVISAVFFGLAHGNLPQFMLAFLLGLFLGHIDMRHNSIVPSVVVHIFINSMVTVIDQFRDNDVIMGLISLGIIVCAIAGLAMLLMFRKESKFPVSTPAQSRRGIAIAKTSVALIAAVAIQVIYLVLLIMMTKK